MNISTFETEILRALHEATQRIPVTPPDAGPTFSLHCAEWRAAQKYGPRFMASGTFGGDATGRQRHRRMVKKLEAAGLITVYRENNRTVRAKLTPIGLRAIGESK